MFEHLLSFSHFSSRGIYRAFDGRRRAPVRGWWYLTLILASPLNSLGAGQTNLQTKVELAVRETFDSNVYLQDADPEEGNVAAAKAAGLDPVQPFEQSWVTSILPKLGLEYRTTAGWTLSGSYAPDITFYHATRSEDYVAHRGTLNVAGKWGNSALELLNTATYIDGSEEGPTFARPGDVPAVGGIPMRDRREAFVFRNGFRFTQTMGNWFLRPVASSYIHDFKTTLRYVPPALRSSYLYENYLDRQEVSGGLDLGYKAFERAHIVLGYRYGRQDQFEGPYGVNGRLIDSPYDSAYHRVLVGVEGAFGERVKVNVSAGPDVRQFSSEVEQAYPDFDDDRLLYYVDASLSLQLTSADALTFRSTRFAQPAFSSFSLYQDIKNDLVWRHLFSARCSSSVGFTVYIGDWRPPVHRNDWVYTPNASFTYALMEKLNAELAYSYDWVDSLVASSREPYSHGREFSRHLVTFGLRYTL